jgi:hypothetical protein
MRRIEANEVSYVWDRAIERFNSDIIGGTVPPELLIHADVAHLERAVRFMAAETRYLRRFLARALVDFHERLQPDQPGSRVVLPFAPGRPLYVFLLLPRPGLDMVEADYRKGRMCRLFAACMAAKSIHREAQFVVGLATEPAISSTHPSELLCLDVRTWSSDDDAMARQLQAQYGVLHMEQARTKLHEHDYPRPKPSPPAPNMRRNGPCPCGSGRKFKYCCRRRA